MDSVPFEPVMMSLVQEAAEMLKNSAVLGLVKSTSPELEPGVGELLAQTTGLFCLQVG